MGRGPIISSVFRDRGQMRQRQQTPNPQGSQRADGVDAAVETRHARQRGGSAVTDQKVGTVATRDRYGKGQGGAPADLEARAVDIRQATEGGTAATDRRRGIGEAGDLADAETAGAVDDQVHSVQAGQVPVEQRAAGGGLKIRSIVLAAVLPLEARQGRGIQQATTAVAFQGHRATADLGQGWQ